jgi:hypothetical protein
VGYSAAIVADPSFEVSGLPGQRDVDQMHISSDDQ